MKRFKKIYIEITNNCNLNCSFCSEVEKKKHFMTKDEFIHILKEIKPYTNTIYLHVKGEPLLHPNILEFLQLAENYNFKVNLTTNGILFSKYAKDLGKYKSLKKINFSLHCENNKEDYLTDIFDNIKYLRDDITKIYRLWTLTNGKYDEKSTKIVNKIISYYKLSTAIVEKLYKENNVKISSTIYVDKDNEFIWPSPQEEKNIQGFCMALKTQIAILSDGTVVPCCLDCNGKVPLGNIFKESFATILKSERLTSLQKSFQDRKIVEKLCLNCTYKERFK